MAENHIGESGNSQEYRCLGILLKEEGVVKVGSRGAVNTHVKNEEESSQIAHANSNNKKSSGSVKSRLEFNYSTVSCSKAPHHNNVGVSAPQMCGGANLPNLAVSRSAAPQVAVPTANPGALNVLPPSSAHPHNNTTHYTSSEMYQNPQSQKLHKVHYSNVLNEPQDTSPAKSNVCLRKTYDIGRILGNGSFGVVCEARCVETGEQVAIKKVLQDPRYKNRELDIMKELHHPNVVELKDYFYTETSDKAGADSNANTGVSASSASSSCNRYLNVVMELIPETVYRVMKTFVKNNQPMPVLLIKLYTYQMCRSLGYLHSLAICHRDIKPQNLLVDSKTHVLKLCDFGSAKRLVPGEQSVAYICSRFYRAPELMLGATEYTNAIDIWSIGCVLGELLLGHPLFAGETSVDQLVKIIQILGTPSRKQMCAMNPNYTEFRFPDVKPKDWRKVLGVSLNCHVDHDLAIELLNKFLRYEPSERLQPLHALAHKFFDELRDPNTRLPGGLPLPDLFLFDELEIKNMSKSIFMKVLPPFYKQSKIYLSSSSSESTTNNSSSPHSLSSSFNSSILTSANVNTHNASNSFSSNQSNNRSTHTYPY